MRVKLTPRMQLIADQVQPGSKVADIGTDHGLIPIYLVQNQLAVSAVACDLNPKPLEKAAVNIEQHRLTGAVETRLGSGLEPLEPGEVDTIIIAGMGGMLIQTMLEEKGSQFPEATFILQPMQAEDVLRRYLLENGFTVERDLLVQESRHFYQILVVKVGKTAQPQPVASELFYEIGVDLKGNPQPVAEAFIQHKISACSTVLPFLLAANDPASLQKRDLFKKKIEALQEVLGWLKQ